MKKIVKKNVDLFVTKAALKVSECGANLTCWWVLHQPKLPKKVKQLRKF